MRCPCGLSDYGIDAFDAARDRALCGSSDELQVSYETVERIAVRRAEYPCGINGCIRTANHWFAVAAALRAELERRSMSYTLPNTENAP